MLNKSTFTLVLFLLLLSSCGIKNYYFPYASFNSSAVYQYAHSDGYYDTQYWHMTYDSNTKKFTTEAYDYDLDQFEEMFELITGKGAEMIAYVPFTYGKRGNMASPEQVDVYKWKDKKPYTFEVTFNSGHRETTMAKTRIYQRKDTITVNGTFYNCVVFREGYKMTNVNSGKDNKFHKISYYAKGIGMVRSETYKPDQEPEFIELEKILTIDEWQDLLEDKRRRNDTNPIY